MAGGLTTIVCLIIAIVLIIAWIVLTIFGFVEDIETGFISLFEVGLIVIIVDYFILSPFVALDKASGSTVGTITAVDKTFWGTTKLYIKTTENNEDTYCIEDETIVNQAKELIGEKVQLYYDERVGLYHLNQCTSSPVEKIEKKD